MKRYLKQNFFNYFQKEAEKFFSCGGRFELLGNHTDHNHGLCLAATCDLAVYAAVRKRDDYIVRLYSEGFEVVEMDLSFLDKADDERGHSSSLIRGINFYLHRLNYRIGGFDAYIKSSIPMGAGVSSSAAFELTIATIINNLFNDNKIDLLTLAKASQFAERNYYDKMCGLLDQIGVAYGGLIYIDFKDIENPIIEPINADFTGYQFVIVNTKSDHSKLSHLYAAIPEDMHHVASFFNKKYLREIDKQSVINNKKEIVNKFGIIAYERSLHFFDENERVKEAYKAIKNNDIPKVIDLMNKSCFSSTYYLRNMYHEETNGSPLEACELIKHSSFNKAGVKINGGGFAGSVIALIPNDVLDNVINICKYQYGENNVHLISVRADIPSELK